MARPACPAAATQEEDDLLAALERMEEGGGTRAFDSARQAASPASPPAPAAASQVAPPPAPENPSLTPFAAIWSAAKQLEPAANAALAATLDAAAAPGAAPVIARSSSPALTAPADALKALDLDAGPVTALDSLLESSAAPAAPPPDDSSRALLLYTTLGAGCAALGRWVCLDAAASGGPLVNIGTLLLAAVLGAFTALGIGLADRAGFAMGARRLAYTTLSGAVVGTLGSFCLIVPMFQVRSVFLRLVVFSAAIALVDLTAERGTAHVALLSVAGLAAGWITSVVPLIDPYSPAPLAMALTFGLMGLSVGMARRMQLPA